MNEMVPEPVVQPGPRGPGGPEVAAVILLLIGGVVFLVGWLIGCLLLWLSPNWRWTEKALGTLIWPGGLVGVALVAADIAWPGPPPGTVCDPGITCIFWPGPPLWEVGAGFAVAALVQIAVAMWLLRQVAQRPSLPRQASPG
jgi:hypothetical protein